jgi:hypothetical protein
LLPGLIEFAYIPKNQHFTAEKQPLSERDVFTTAIERITTKSYPDNEEHVLVLEFLGSKKSSGSKKQSDQLVPLENCGLSLLQVYQFFTTPTCPLHIGIEQTHSEAQ